LFLTANEGSPENRPVELFDTSEYLC
jgi:hypothetical protein